MPKPRKAVQPSVRFTLDERNRPVTLDALGVSRVIEGQWTLSADHELSFIGRQAAKRRTVFLKANLLKAHPAGLVATVHHIENADHRINRQIILSGRWQADDQNRLAFLVDRGEGKEDDLVFQAAWEVGSDHAILYRFRRHLGGARSRQEQALVFKGSWDIAQRNRLVFRLEGSDQSAFSFAASLESPSLRAEEGKLAHQVGIRVSEGKLKRQRVILFGAWKVNPDLSVSFEIPYAEGRVASIRLSGRVSVSRRNAITVALYSARGEPVGLSVIFTRKLFRNAALFLRLEKSAEESSVIGGVQIRF